MSTNLSGAWYFSGLFVQPLKKPTLFFETRQVNWMKKGKYPSLEIPKREENHVGQLSS